jgi:hypothetical protein
LDLVQLQFNFDNFVAGVAHFSHVGIPVNLAYGVEVLLLVEVLLVVLHPLVHLLPGDPLLQSCLSISRLKELFYPSSEKAYLCLNQKPLGKIVSNFIDILVLFAHEAPADLLLKCFEVVALLHHVLLKLNNPDHL